jgi:hypothetical protein
MERVGAARVGRLWQIRGVLKQSLMPVAEAKKFNNTHNTKGVRVCEWGV